LEYHERDLAKEEVRVTLLKQKRGDCKI
jgi:hypothetical protein